MKKVFIHYVVDNSVHLSSLKKFNYEDGLIENDEFLGGIKNAFINNDYNPVIYSTTKVFNFVPQKYIYNRYYNFLFLLIFYKINSILLSLRIKKLFKKEKFDVYYTITNNYINQNLLSYLKTNKVKTIQWFGSFPSKRINNASYKNAKFFDLIVSSGNLKPFFTGKHKLSNYLDIYNGFNENLFENLNQKKDIDILFIGGLMKKHSNRWEILEFLYKTFPTIQIYGYGISDIPNRYEFKKIVKKGVWGFEYVEKIKKSKICLNLFLDGYKDYQGVNKRIFEVLACKTLLVTKFNPGLKKYFDINKDLVVFENKADLKGIIQFYLNNNLDRDFIAMNGYEKVQKFNYTNQINSILNQM